VTVTTPVTSSELWAKSIIYCMSASQLSYAHQSAAQQPKVTKLTPRLITEFIGTFFLVFTVALNVDESRDPTQVGWNPLAIGFALMTMIFMGGHISGAHYNPAVSLGVYLRGKSNAQDFLFYVLTQLAGGFFGSLMAFAVSHSHFSPAPGPGISAGQAFAAELFFTFALVLVVLNVATTMSQEDNSFFGFAIGMTVACGAWSVGPISGAVFNPAVETGLLLVDAFAGDAANWQYVWLYILAEVVGAVCAAAVFRLQNPTEFARGEHVPLVESEGMSPSERQPL